MHEVLCSGNCRRPGYRQEGFKTFLIPVLASGLMGLVAWLIYEGSTRLFVLGGMLEQGEMNWFYNLLCLAMAVLAAVPTYFGLVIKLGAIGKRELEAMPGGRTIVGIVKKLHLL